MMSADTSSLAAIYPDDHAIDDQSSREAPCREAPCLYPPMHPSANPNAESCSSGDEGAPDRASVRGLTAGKPAVSVVAAGHSGSLDEPVAVRPAGPASDQFVLEPHDEAPAVPYCEDEGSPRSRDCNDRGSAL